MNVFLGENKSIKIGDLGVARTMTGDFASTVVGTPYYLSPEMCEEKPYN
jgi:NIMA (never in mitosis gene a)-related kinase